MDKLEQMARAALHGESLSLRSLAQDWLRDHPDLSRCQRPQTDDPALLTMAAALVELFAERRNQSPPEWAESVRALPEPLFLLKSARTMKRLRELCRTRSPEPLRRRGLYAPPNFLEFV